MAGVRFRFHHGGLSVPDLDEAVRWYGDVLSFQVEERVDLPDIPARVAMMRNGSLCMELFEVVGAKPLPPERREPNQDLKTHGNKHVAFQVEDLDALKAELQRRGADIVWFRRSTHASFMFIRDNAGNLIEFLERDAPRDSAFANLG